MIASRMWEWLGVLALCAATLWTVSGRVAPYPYGYDEADYLWIAEKGWMAHWTESPSLTLPEFVRLGTGRGQDPAGRKQLSEMVRKNGYVDFYRHWHGPLYFYWLIASSGVIAAGEQTARMLQMIFLAAVFLLVYGGVRSLWGAPAAFASALAAAISYTNVQTSLQLIPHTLFVFCYMASLLLAARWLQGGSIRNWYGAVAAAALAFTTLEVALVLIVTLAACAWWKGGDGGSRVRFAISTLGVFAAVVLAAWPTALLKLSFIKAYAFMAYLALFRKAAWGGDSVAGSWWQRIESSPVEWALFAAGLAYLAMRRRQAAPLAPLAIFGVLMIAAVGKVAASEPLHLLPRYQAPYVTALLTLGCVAVAAAASRWGARGQWGAAVAIVALLSWNTWRQFERNPTPQRFPWLEAISLLKQSDLSGKVVLAPQSALPMMRYYLREVEWRGYGEELAAPGLGDAVKNEGAVGAVWLDRDPQIPTGQARELTRAYSGERLALYTFGEAR